MRRKNQHILMSENRERSSIFGTKREEVTEDWRNSIMKNSAKYY
jgi:hypothetical protein